MTLQQESVMNRLLTIPEVAEVLRVSTQKAYMMAARGDIPTVRIGRNVRVRQDRLERWLDLQR